MSTEMQMSQLLSDMQALRLAAQQKNVLPQFTMDSALPVESSGDKQATFGNLLQDAIHKVNDLQQESGELKKRYELGDSDIDIVQVMVASEKAKVGFTAMTEVRNKFVEAYREVMNMAV